MKNLRAKLKNRRGESLVEVLASILIGSLSVTLLVSMIMAAVHINKKAETYDADYYKTLSSAEGQNPGDEYTASDPSGSGTVTVVEEGAATPYTLEITYYGGKGICSYAKKETGSP